MTRRSFAREPYQEHRQRLQQRWRPHVLERDRGRCRCCGSREDLEMAHVTDCVAFSRAAGRKEGVTFSFRWDNLVMLCTLCHAASHAERLEADQLARRGQVDRFLESVRRLRGWSSPYAVLPPELVPPQLRPHRSFHDVLRLTPLVPFPTYARYASDGGLAQPSPDVPPQQARLPEAGRSGAPEGPGGEMALPRPAAEALATTLPF